MPTLPSNSSQLFDTPIFNALIPAEGPKALSIVAPFDGSGGSFDVNLLLTQSQQFMSMVQAVFIDNSLNASGVVITSSGVNQTLKCPAHSQAYLPLLVTKNGALNVQSAGAANVTFIFLNVPLPAIVWAV